MQDMLHTMGGGGGGGGAQVRVYGHGYRRLRSQVVNFPGDAEVQSCGRGSGFKRQRDTWAAHSPSARLELDCRVEHGTDLHLDARLKLGTDLKVPGHCGLNDQSGIRMPWEHLMGSM